MPPSGPLTPRQWELLRSLATLRDGDARLLREREKPHARALAARGYAQKGRWGCEDGRKRRAWCLTPAGRSLAAWEETS